MFRKVLVANRGAIATRILRTLRRMGVGTVAVYSDADAHAPHVTGADEAVRVGPPPAAESYLAVDRILDAARATGAEALHPGYGFLSENAAFAERCEAAGLVFLGPTPAQMRDFGLKHTARALARGWADDPTGASRPFDRRRNGLVLGEGAGVFVLERKDFADARGAAAHADVLGWGVTNDAHHPTTPRPDGEGARECMRRALADSGLTPADIGYLNAHGTSTKLGDAAEALAVRALFGAETPPVSSTKAVTGHMLGASGVVESAVCVQTLRTGQLPPTHNLDDPDPDCELDHIRKDPRAAAVEHVMSNSFGFGGHNVSVVYGRPSTRRTRTA